MFRKQMLRRHGNPVLRKRNCILVYIEMSTYEWDARNQQIIDDSYDVLGRTSASIARSHQISIETEQIGTEVLSELSEQRESLLRTQNRLENANDNLTQSNRIIRGIQKHVFYNKFILILIIILEMSILTGLIALKFIK